MIEIYESDDVTLVSDLAFPSLEAGQDSTVLELHVWNNQGDPGGEDETDLRLVVYLEDPANPGTYLKTGLPPQDELWCRVRLVGQNNAARPEQREILTDWQPIGASADLIIDSLLAGGARHLEVKMRPPSSASQVSYRWRLGIVTGENAYPVPGPVSELGRGILTGVGEPGRAGLVRGGALTASPTPDDQVHVAAATWLHAGRLYGKVGTSHTLGQTDGSAAALAVGESYVATLSLAAGGVTVTKGDKAATPTTPAVPAGEVLIDSVTVLYDGGGTSVIDPADLAGATLYDRYHAAPGAGLELVMHPGFAVAGGTYRYRRGKEALPLTSTATNTVWQLASGAWSVTTTAARPEPLRTRPPLGGRHRRHHRDRPAGPPPHRRRDGHPPAGRRHARRTRPGGRPGGGARRAAGRALHRRCLRQRRRLRRRHRL